MLLEYFSLNIILFVFLFKMTYIELPYYFSLCFSFVACIFFSCFLSSGRLLSLLTSLLVESSIKCHKLRETWLIYFNSFSGAFCSTQVLILWVQLYSLVLNMHMLRFGITSIMTVSLCHQEKRKATEKRNRPEFSRCQSQSPSDIILHGSGFSSRTS